MNHHEFLGLSTLATLTLCAVGCSENGNLPPEAVIIGVPVSFVDHDGDGQEQVMLDGSSSSDPDGGIIAYIWSEDGIEIATGSSATIFLALGGHTITLQVTDNEGASDSETVSLEVLAGDDNGPAGEFAADAGADREFLIGDPGVILEGSASGGSGDYSFTWSPSTALDDPNVADPIATPTQDITYTLTVTDLATRETASDSIMVTVLSRLPDLSAAAGGFEFLAAEGSGATVQLDGRDSTGMAPLTFSWTYVEGPLISSPPAIQSSSTPTPFALPIGNHVIRLRVEDATERPPVDDDVIIHVYLPNNADHDYTPSTTVCTQFAADCVQEPDAFFTIAINSDNPLEPIQSSEGEFLVMVAQNQVAVTDEMGTRYVTLLLESRLGPAFSVPGSWHQSNAPIALCHCRTQQDSDVIESCDPLDESCVPPSFPEPFADSQDVSVLLSEGVHYILHTATNGSPETADMLATFETKLNIVITP